MAPQTIAEHRLQSRLALVEAQILDMQEQINKLVDVAMSLKAIIDAIESFDVLEQKEGQS